MRHRFVILCEEFCNFEITWQPLKFEPYRSREATGTNFVNKLQSFKERNISFSLFILRATDVF